MWMCHSVPPCASFRGQGVVWKYTVNQNRCKMCLCSQIQVRTAMQVFRESWPYFLQYSLWVVLMCCKQLAQIQSQTTLTHKDHSDYFAGVGEDMLC